MKSLKSVGHAGKDSNKHTSSELLIKILKSTSSEEERIHLCRATDLLHEFMKGRLLEGITYCSNAKSRVMDWILAEVFKGGIWQQADGMKMCSELAVISTPVLLEGKEHPLCMMRAI